MVPAQRYCATCGAANPSGATVCFACGLSLKITLPLSQEPLNSLPPDRFLKERYHIIAQVGKGGFGAVYKAEDLAAGKRLVAIKEISLSGLKPQEMITATDGFNREVLLLSDLRHPNLPRIYDHFSDGACWYLVMDFIEGKALEQYLDQVGEACFSIEEVLNIAIQLCTVLDYLHTRQPPIIFRDLKPTNIMLTPDGRLFLVDFGIARHFKPGQVRDTTPFGSPGYAAPEQYGKAQTTPRADIYSLGVTLHQLLSGSDPSESPFRFAPLRLQSHPLLIKLETLVMQMVEMDASKRPGNVAIVRQELQSIAAQWATQYRAGLPPKVVASPIYQPPAAPRQPYPAMTTGPAFVGKAGQMIVLRQASPAMGFPFTVPGSMPMPRRVPTPQQRNGVAIASMIFGIVSLFLPVLFCAGFFLYLVSPFVFFFIGLCVLLCPLLAIICGHIGHQRIRKNPALKSSSEMATLGLILGYIMLSVYLVAFLGFVVAFAVGGGFAPHVISSLNL